MRIRREHVPTADNFTIVPNAWARDPNLSRRAVGMLVELLSHREGWEVTVESLWRGGTEGRAAVTATLKELEAAGYLVRRQTREGNRFGSAEYVITDPATGSGDGLSGDGLSADVPSADVPSADVPSANDKSVTKKNNPKNTKGEDQGRRGAAFERPSPPERASVAPAPNLEPTGRCAAHADGDPGTPCRACGIARREREEWLADAPRRRAEAEREATRRFLAEQRAKKPSPRASEHIARIKAELAGRAGLRASTG